MKICFKISTLLHVMEDIVLNHRKKKKKTNIKNKTKNPASLRPLCKDISYKLFGNTLFCINKY